MSPPNSTARNQEDDAILVGLVQRAKAGERSAERELVELFQHRLFRFCFYLAGSREEAEDLFQDVLILILRSLGQLKEVESFVAWAFCIVRNRHYSRVKKSNKSPLLTQQQIESYSLEPLSDERVEERLTLLKVLGCLKKDDRAMILMFHVESRTISEIARQVGMSDSAVGTRLHRIRAKLKKLLERM